MTTVLPLAETGAGFAARAGRHPSFAVGAALTVWHRHLGMSRESAEKRGTWRLGRGEEKISSNRTDTP